MSYFENPDVLKAGLIVIGNEILSGRTADKNINWIATRLSAQGIALVEVRVVPDIEEKVVRTIHALSDECDYVFTTGGIGPTHDDITAACVAKAFDAGLEYNEEAYQALLAYYGSQDEVTEARKRMCMIPEGADLIPNTVSGAPGFIMKNVYVMAGVPRIMHAMFDHLAHNHLGTGALVLSNSIMCGLQESQIAGPLGDLQAQYDDVEIGSYPQYREGVPSVNIVLRGTDKDSLKVATRALLDLLDEMGAKPTAMSFQAQPD